MKYTLWNICLGKFKTRKRSESQISLLSTTQMCNRPSGRQQRAVVPGRTWKGNVKDSVTQHQQQGTPPYGLGCF